MSLSKRVRFQVLVRDKYTCQYCGSRPPDTVLEIDHVIPRSRGGSDRIENLKTACWNCNRGKSAMAMLHTWTFVDGQHEPGPLVGQTVQRFEQLPAYWIYQHRLGFEKFEDEIDADLWFGKWDRHFKWGVPFRSQLARNAWYENDTPRSYNERGERILVGFYIANVDKLEARELVWYPGCSVFEYDIELATQPHEGEDGA